MAEQDKHTTTPPGEITFRDLILKLVEYFRELVHFKYALLVFSLVFMLFFGIRALWTPPEYKAQLSFMIDEDSGNPYGAISGVLGAFGINSKGKNNLARVLELSRSRRILQQALFSRTSISGRDDYLANHLIEYLDSLGKWNRSPWYRFSRAATSDLDSFRFSAPFRSGIENDRLGAMKKLVETVAGNPETGSEGMMETGYDVESRIMRLTMITRNPELSASLTDQIFDELSRFYINTSIEKQKTTYNVLRTKTDSLRQLIDLKETQLASLADSWLGSYSRQSKLRQEQLDKEIRLLNIALGESIKNLEIADFAVKNTLPYIQIIDRPELPLQAVKPSWLKASFLGFFLGAGIFIFLVFFRKLIRDALNTPGMED